MRSADVAGRRFHVLLDDTDPQILHLGIECAHCERIVAVCTYDGSGSAERATGIAARHLIRWAREHVCLLLLVLAVTVVTVGCGDDPGVEPPEWRMTSTLPGQHLGQTGTPKLYPTTTLP